LATIWLEPPRRGVVARGRVASIQDVRAIEQTPYLDLLPSWSILGMIEHTSAVNPAKSAIVVADRHEPTRIKQRLTYAELAYLVRGIASSLREVSGTANPVVSILTPLLPESFIALWAGATAGIANPINPFLRIEHVASIMNAAGTTVLICGVAADGAGAWNEVGRLRAMVPTLREVWHVDHSSCLESFRQLADAGSRGEPGIEQSPDPHRTTALLHTGGTTAVPKLVRLTERGQLLNAWCSGTWNGSGAEEIVAVGMPYFHVGGAVILSRAALLFGQTIVLVGPEGYRNPHLVARFWDFVQAHGVTQAGCAPTTAAAIATNNPARRAPAGFGIWAGGGAVPVQVAREFAAKFGVPLREGWGMTELQGALIINPNGVEPRLGSIGLPFPYHRALCVPLGSRTVSLDTTPGTLGVLAISGPCVTPGYLDTARNSDLFFDSTAGATWLNTGDLCTIDPDGYIWHRGRSKDLIIRGGHNIDPLAIETALLQHPAVLHAAAIGEPDRDKGEVPIAYVQPRPGMSVTESELIEHCHREITERAAVPRVVRFIEAMPVTAVGKIFKPALRLDAVRHCIDAVTRAVCRDSGVGVEIRDAGGAIIVVLSVRDSSITDAAHNLRRELERYTFRVEIETNPA